MPKFKIGEIVKYDKEDFFNAYDAKIMDADDGTHIHGHGEAPTYLVKLRLEGTDKFDEKEWAVSETYLSRRKDVRKITSVSHKIHYNTNPISTRAQILFEDSSSIILSNEDLAQIMCVGEYMSSSELPGEYATIVSERIDCVYSKC